MEDKLKAVLADILNVSKDSINADSGADNIASWDSLNHMNLIVAIEEEFGVSFSEEEMIDLTNFKALQKKLSEKLS